MYICVYGIKGLAAVIINRIINRTILNQKVILPYGYLSKFFFLVFCVFLALFEMELNAKDNNYLNTVGVEVLSSSKTEIVIKYRPIVTDVTHFLINEQEFFKPKIEGASEFANHIGEPFSLVLNADITLPSANNFSFEIVKIGKVNEINGFMPLFSPYLPFEQYLTDLELQGDQYKKNYSEYKTPNWVEMSYLGVARDRYVGQLHLTASRFNAQTAKIEIASELIVKIKFQEVRGDLTTNSGHKKLGKQLSTYRTLNNNVAEDFIQQREKDYQIEKSLYDYVNSSLSGKKGYKTQAKEKISDGQWFKLEISQTGFYRITLQQLKDLGFNPEKDDINSIKIFGNGGKELSETQLGAPFNLLNEQEIYLENDGSTTNTGLSSVVFFAEGPNGFYVSQSNPMTGKATKPSVRLFTNPYSKTSSYLLTWGGIKAKGKSDFVLNETPVNYPESYIQRIGYDEDLTMIFPEGAGRIFLGRSNFSEPFRNMLFSLDRTGDILYRCQVANKDAQSTFFSFSENGKNIASRLEVIGQGNASQSQYNHGNYYLFEMTQKASAVGQDNRSVFKIDATNPGNPNPLTFFDYLEIHYPRSLVPIDNEIEIFSDVSLTGVTQYNITGFLNTNKYAVDITDIKNPVILKNLSKDSDKFIFNTYLDSLSYKHFFVSTKTKTPIINKIDFADLRNDLDGADLIVITNKDLLNSAQSYREYREQNSSLKVKVIEVESIYNEFSSGMVDPTAIRDFLAFAYTNWKIRPSYVLMWGKGHFDYRNITTKIPSFVPVYETNSPVSNGDKFPAFNEISASCYDDYFVRIVGSDALPDLAIGRLPIDSPKSGFDYLNKIKQYENNSATDNWRTSTIMLADDGPTYNENDGSGHINNTESLIDKYLPSEYYANKVYLPDFPTVFLSSQARSRRKPAVTPFLIDKINNEGGLLFNFVGHGNPKLLTHEQVFERDRDIQLLTNYNKLFFLVAATCDFAKFDNPSFRDGTSEMLLSDKGGAIGALAASRVVYSSENAALNNSFFKILFSQKENGDYYNIGEVGYLLKQEMTDENSQKYFIFADPTMKLLMPKYHIQTNYLNGKVIDETNNLNIKALSKYTFKGNVYLNDKQTVASNFNGQVTLTIYDADNKATVKDEVNSYTYKRYGGLLSKTKAEVENGEFEIEFVLPKDVSLGEDFIRVNFLAYNEQKELATGKFSSIKVNEIDTNIVDDKTGPEINLFMNDKHFIDGGTVGTNAMLNVEIYDPIGINSTGNGIGRKIEAWLDGAYNSINLTSNFRTDDLNYRKGYTYSLLSNLSAGKHTAKVRAWDLFNNFTVSEINFVVQPELDGVILSNLLNSPNPFFERTKINFSHNVSLPANIKVDIYNSIAVKVRSFYFPNTQATNVEFYWDGQDEGGNLLPSGAYYYTVTFSNSIINGVTAAGSQIMYINTY